MKQPPHPAPFSESERREDSSEPCGVGKNCANDAIAQTFLDAPAPILLNIAARVLDQPAIAHPRGTGGFASAAFKAEIEMAHCLTVEVQASFRQRLHQIDAAARGIHLSSCDYVGRARFQAQST